MTTSLSRSSGIALLLAAAAALGACSSRNQSAARTDTTTAAAAAPNGAVDTTAAAGAVATDSSAHHSGWSDADILAYLHDANTGEIAAAKVAERKATNPSVKSFARRMVTDHTALDRDGEALAKKLNINVDTASQGDVKDLVQHNQDALQDLNNKSAGQDWDKDYIGKQVDAHQQVVDHLNDFLTATQNPQLKAALQKALPKVQAHLTAAKDIQQNGLAS